MIDLLDTISDESLAAYIDGNANNFERIKIDTFLPASSNLSEVIDIVNDINCLNVESLTFEDVGIEFPNLNFNELNNKIR